MRIRLLLFLLLPAFLLNAQRQSGDNIIDVVETLRGERYEGTIVHYEYGKLITIRLAEDGREISLASSEVRRLRYGDAKVATEGATRETFIEDWRNEVQPRPVKSRLRPFLSLAVHGGKVVENNNFFFRDDRIFGFTVEGGLNYRFVPWLAVGMAAAYDRFATNRDESTFAGLLTLDVLPSQDKALAPFLRLGLGYGVPLGSQQFEIDDSEGGLLIHPSVGLRLGKTDQVYYTADLGYRFLSTSFSAQTFAGQEVISNEYRRLSMRFAVTF